MTKQQLKDWATGTVTSPRWLLLAVCLLLLADGRAWAATNLVWSCPTAGGNADSCNASASWNTTGAVLACDTDACSWGAATWRTRSSVPSTRQTLTCVNDVPVGSRSACGANYSGERWLAIGGAVTPPPPPPPDPEPPVVDPPGPAPTGFARITWAPPTRFTDGTPLENLTGYRISYGLGMAALSATIDIDNPAVTAYDISGLVPGTWYFGVQSMAGSLSAMSNLATKTILADEPPPPPPAPIDCAVSAWSSWTGGAWSACAAGTQERQETRSRTVLTQPANGGAACPALTETRTASQACTVVPPPPAPISLQCTLAGQSTNYANGDERFTLRCAPSDLNRLDTVTVTRP